MWAERRWAFVVRWVHIEFWRVVTVGVAFQASSRDSYKESMISSTGYCGSVMIISVAEASNY
jgi:hypothetical protein